MLQETTAKPTFYHKSVISRTAQLGIAHDLFRKLGYETRVGKPGRERYENKLESLIGKRSLKSASRAERNTVISALERDLAARTQRPVYSADEHQAIVNADSLESLWG